MTITLVKSDKEIITIDCLVRETGKVAAKQNRKKNLIPACVYGKDFQNLNILINHKVAQKLRVGQIVNLKVNHNGNTNSYKCVVKDIQYNYLGDSILHLDFMVLVEGRFIEIEVPIEFTGESQGVKKGGVLQILLDKLTIKVSPDNIPEKVVLDISNLDIGDTLHVGDLVKDENLKPYLKNIVFVNKLDTPIVTISSESTEQEST